MAYKPYPRSLYRPAEGGFEYEGKHYEVLTVENEEEEKAAKADGFLSHPDKAEPKKPVKRVARK